MKRDLDIPQIVVDRALTAGADGEKWLSELPNVISLLEEKWRITVEITLSGGTQAFAAYAAGIDGKQYVLKVDMPGTVGHPDFVQAVKTLLLADGQGYVKLFAYDEEKRACLLERLGKPLKDFPYSVSEQLEIICTVLKKAWCIPVADSFPKTDGDGSISWFRQFIRPKWEELRRPCSEAVVEQAYRFLISREAHKNPEEYVLLHGDAHNTNILEDLSAPNSFKLIDPDGLFYEKAYDLGVLMREWREEYCQDPVKKGRERCEYLHRLTGVDAQAIFEWGFLQCVSTGLLFWNVNQAIGKELLDVAEAWCLYV